MKIAFRADNFSHDLTGNREKKTSYFATSSIRLNGIDTLAREATISKMTLHCLKHGVYIEMNKQINT